MLNYSEELRGSKKSTVLVMRKRTLNTTYAASRNQGEYPTWAGRHIIPYLSHPPQSSGT